MEPDIRYAKSGDIHIAYQLMGDGDIDIVHVPGILSLSSAGFADEDRAVACRHARMTT